MAAKRTSRNRPIDVLRALAIMLVLGRHMDPCPPEVNLYLNTFTEFWYRIGGIGVDLFFVLSGFLVSSLLFRESLTHSRISITRFLIRRGLKIYPSFYVFILFTILYRKFQLEYPIYLNSLLGELLFLQNYIGNLWGYTWTLAVEEHFYLFLVLLLYWFNRRDVKYQHRTPFVELPQVAIAIFIGCLLLRLITSFFVEGAADSNSYILLFPTHLRIDSVMFGVLLAWAWHFKSAWLKKKVLSKRWLLAISGVLFVLLPFWLNLDRSMAILTVGLSSFYLGFGLLMLGTIKWKLKESMFLKIVTTIGYCSYSIYLWHGPVHWWLLPALDKFVSPAFLSNWYLYFFSYFLGSIAVGYLLTKAIEQPVLLMRNKFFPSRTRALKF